MVESCSIAELKRLLNEVVEQQVCDLIVTCGKKALTDAQRMCDRDGPLQLTVKHMKSTCKEYQRMRCV